MSNIHCPAWSEDDRMCFELVSDPAFALRPAPGDKGELLAWLAFAICLPVSARFASDSPDVVVAAVQGGDKVNGLAAGMTHPTAADVARVMEDARQQVNTVWAKVERVRGRPAH